MASLYKIIADDIRLKAKWNYGSAERADMIKTLFTDGTAAMILYRLMQWSRHRRLSVLEMLFNKLNTIFCNCIIGRGAEFGEGLVLVHASGVAINGNVRGGSRIYIEHQVTIGPGRGEGPPLA